METPRDPVETEPPGIDDPALPVDEPGPDEPGPDGPRPRDDALVPVWLAALVLVLLLAVMGLGGYILAGYVSASGEDTPLGREIAAAEQAVAHAPDDPAAHLALGFAYQQERRFDDALVEYDLVLKYSPQDTAASYNMGMVLFELGRDQEAEERLWDVLEVDETHVLAAKALGEYYAEREEYRSLVVAVRPAVQAHETAADLQYLMGLAYENLNRLDWAEARYRLALTYVPDMEEAHDGLARLGVDDAPGATDE